MWRDKSMRKGQPGPSAKAKVGRLAYEIGGVMERSEGDKAN